MIFLRRPSRQASGRELSEEDIITLRQQRRKSSFAVAQTVSHDDPLFTVPVKPAIEIFPNSTSARQETLIISPDPMNKNFTIIKAGTCEHFLTISTPSTSLPAQSHVQQFYGTLPKQLQHKDSKDSNSNSKGGSGTPDPASTFNRSPTDTNNDGDTNDTTPPHTKLFTMDRDALSLRKRHHVSDPYNGHRIMQIEFSPVSSWDTHALKANIELLNKYSTYEPMEPRRLRWQGKKHSLEGVLEAHNKPVAVCAKGEETAESGDYILYVAPGMDLYVACCVIMAVDDRTRRSSDDGHRGSLGAGLTPPSNESGDGEVVWREGYQ